MFSNSSGSGFGSANAFSTNTSNSSGGLFGTKPSATGGGMFGGSNTSTSQQPSGLFGNSGSNNPASSSTGGLFGNNNITQSNNTNGGLFGNNNTQTNNTNATGGLFGNNPPKPATAAGGLFGSSNTASNSSTSGGLFGNSAATNNTTTTNSSGMFGVKAPTETPTNNLFGNSNTQSSTSTGLFGNNTASRPAGGLFGNTGTAQPSSTPATTGGLFGNSNTTSTPSLFGNSSNQPSSGLFGNSTQNSLHLGGNNSALGTPPTKQYNVKDLPKSLTDSEKTHKTNHPSHTRKRSFSTTNTPAGSIMYARSSLLERFSTRFNNLKNDSEFNAEGLFSPKKDFVQHALGSEKSTSVSANTKSKRTFRTFGSNFNLTNRRGPSTTGSTSDFLKLKVDPSRTEARRLKIFGETGGVRKVRILGSENESTVETVKADPIVEPVQIGGNPEPQLKTDDIHADAIEVSDKVEARDCIPKETKESDYWCSPSIEQLSSLSLRQLSEIPDFAIGRRGYGSIQFDLPVDLTAFWSDLPGYLFGNIVRFNKNKTVEVYPNGSVPLGTGLNVPATITLEKVFPITISGKKRMDNLTANDAELRLFVKKLKQLNDMEFVTYDPINGSWTFKVEHFSIWGLVDEDVVIVDSSTAQSTNTDHQDVAPRPLSNASTVNTAKGPFMVASTIPTKRLKPRNSAEDTFVFRKRRQDQAFDVENSFVMPGSFILHNKEDTEEDDESFTLFKPESNMLDNEEDDVSAPVSDAEEAPSFDRESSILVDEDDYDEEDPTGYHEKQYEPVDVEDKDFAYLATEQHFAVADDWEKQLELCSGTQSAFSDDYVRATTRYDAPFSKGFSASEVEKLLFGDSTDVKPVKDVEKTYAIGDYKIFSYSAEKGLVISSPSSTSPLAAKSHTGLLDEQDKSFIRTIYKEHIRQSKIVHRRNEFPLVSPNPKLDFKFVASIFESHPEFRVSSVWKLASVIFDAQEVPTEIYDIKKADVAARVLDIKHREGLLGWIKTEIREEIQAKITSSSDMFEQIFLTLTLNNISDAATLAIKSNNPHLSVLVTLLGSNDGDVKYSAGKQIEYWEKNSIWHNIPPNLQKVYFLLKGDSLNSKVVDGLSWKARLSLLLSYGDLNESLCSLLTTFIDSEASSDIPSDDDSQLSLLKLFVTKQSGKYNVTEIFSSLSDKGKFDVSLKWYLYEILIRSTKKLSFGDRDSNVSVGDSLTLLYADQLISNSLYEESVFVLSHLENDGEVNASISKLVTVNIEKFGEINGLIDNLSTVLQVPSKLIIEAKALHFRFTGDIWQEASYLLDAENYIEAHKTIIEKVAPAAVINNGPKLKLLEEYIGRFPEQHGGIKDWNVGLAVYKNYIQSVRLRTESSLRYLVENLPFVKQSNFKVVVAVRLMSKKVAQSLVELSRSEGNSFLELDKQKVLKLPLGEDAPYFAKDFAVEYFKQILTGV